MKTYYAYRLRFLLGIVGALLLSRLEAVPGPLAADPSQSSPVTLDSTQPERPKSARIPLSADERRRLAECLRLRKLKGDLHDYRWDCALSASNEGAAGVAQQDQTGETGNSGGLDSSAVAEAGSPTDTSSPNVAETSNTPASDSSNASDMGANGSDGSGDGSGYAEGASGYGGGGSSGGNYSSFGGSGGGGGGAGGSGGYSAGGSGGTSGASGSSSVSAAHPSSSTSGAGSNPTSSSSTSSGSGSTPVTNSGSSSSSTSGSSSTSSGTSGDSTVVWLNSQWQTAGDKGTSFRPMTQTGGSANFYLTAQTIVDNTAPATPTAAGQATRLSVSSQGTSVSNAGSSIQQFALHYDNPVVLHSLQLGLVGVTFGGGLGNPAADPMLFLETQAPNPNSIYNIVLDTAALEQAFITTGTQTGYLDFSKFVGISGLLADTLVYSFVFQDTGNVLLSYERSASNVSTPEPSFLVQLIILLVGVSAVMRRQERLPS